MSEKNEQLRSQVENRSEHVEAAARQLDKLGSKVEKGAELSSENIESSTENAKKEALENAISIESGGKEKDKKDSQSHSVRRTSLGKKQLNSSFSKTIKQVQAELPTINRVFSSFIHNKAIEKSSEIIGNTVARPNAILFGGVSAFVLTLIVYVTAKKIGYQLSGFETIAAFIFGWFIGIVYDYLKLLITGKK